MIHLFMLLGAVLVVVEVVMLVFWVLYLIRRNLNLIDIAWGMGFIAAVLVDFLLGFGFIWRKILILTVVSTWALRLVWQLAGQLLEDPPYARSQFLLNKWPYASYPLLQVFTFLAFQGLLITLLSVPFALMSQDILPFFSTCEIFGLLIWMGGMEGVTFTHRQLTRLPTYFFEWIIWVGYCMMALSAPFGWLSILAPVLMFYLLVKGFGIPLTAAQSSQAKETYQDSAVRLSVLFPWLRKKKSPQIQEQSIDLPPVNLEQMESHVTEEKP